MDIETEKELAKLERQAVIEEAARDPKKKSEIVQKAKKALRELKAHFEDQKKNGQPAPLD